MIDIGKERGPHYLEGVEEFKSKSSCGFQIERETYNKGKKKL